MTTIDVSTKICSRCEQEKPVSEFYKAYGYAGGIKSECKKCFTSRIMKEYVYQNIQEKQCKKCNSFFVPKGNNQYFCSTKCRGYTKKEPQQKHCVRCRNEFLPTIHHQRYCSDDCRKESHKEMQVALSQNEGLTKKCFTCDTEKPLSAYRKQHTGQYGVMNHCKECTSRKHLQETYGDEQTSTCDHCWTEFQKIGEAKKYCSLKCKGAVRRKRYKLAGKVRPKRTPEKMEKDNLYARERRKNNPEVAIRCRMYRQIRKAATRDGVATLIWGALKRNGESKRVEELLGYTISDLRTHLERQFTKGMSWEIFMQGKIHIDHIHPKASFNLADDVEWKTCWSLPNLRPMWAKDNLEKRAKILTLL